MTMPPPLPAPAYDHDADHLRILSICWYVLSALNALIACVILLYILFGVILALFGAAAGTAAGNAARDPAAAAGAVPFVGVGLMVICFGGFVFLLVGLFAFLHFKTARALTQRKNLTLCYVMAALACPGVPMGTLLGVFTFIVLSRPTVRASFR